MVFHIFPRLVEALEVRGAEKYALLAYLVGGIPLRASPELK
jgi:hypothetical protein